MTLLSIDPGRSATGKASIGISVFDNGLYQSRRVKDLEEPWAELFRGPLSYAQLTDMMAALARGNRVHFPMHDLGPLYVTEVVIENFVNNDRSRGGQTNGTSECIGMVEFACGFNQTGFYRQEPAALGPAKLHAPEGSYKKLKHLRHEDSAFLHGYEFLVRRGDIEVDLSATMGS